MKTRLALPCLCLGLGLVIGLNLPSVHASLPGFDAGISGRQRAAIVASLRAEAHDQVYYWAEYYAITPAERAWWYGRAQGIDLAATYLENFGTTGSAANIATEAP